MHLERAYCVWSILWLYSAFIFEDNISLHLSGPIEQIYIHNQMSYTFNIGLIIPFDTSLSNFNH